MFKSIGVVIQEYLAEKEIEDLNKIWVNHQKAEDGIAIYETGGFPTRYKGRVEQVYTIQIRTKYSNPSQGSRYSHEVINEIHNLLISIANQDVVDKYVYYVGANQPPTFFRYENQKMVYICNFTISVKEGGI